MATEVITDPLVLSSGRIIRKAAHSLAGSDVDWPIVAAGVVLAQPAIGSAIKTRVLELHQPRVWGIKNMQHVDPIREIKECTECHKSYPCPTVEAVS